MTLSLCKLDRFIAMDKVLSIMKWCRLQKEFGNFLQKKFYRFSSLSNICGQRIQSNLAKSREPNAPAY